MFYSLQRIVRRIRRQKQLGAGVLVTVIILSLIGNTLTFYFFDRTVRPEINIWDGFWYSVVSITTIGYGDISASTLGSRIGTAVFIILIGLATFTTAIGMIVDWIVDLRQKERTGMGRQPVRDHLVVVNFPSEARVRQIIDEFRGDSQHSGREIVLLTDQIVELPFKIDHVSFTRGWPLERDTYERANIGQARQAIVLSPGYDDPRSDSMVASITFVLHNINPDLRVVAECLDPKHDVLFSHSNQLSLVYPLRMANNLLVQEAQDPGVTRLTHAITSNEIEGTLASTKVSSAPSTQARYAEVAKKLLDHGVNLVGFIRGDQVVVELNDLEIAADDSLVYVSKSRHSWDDLRGFLA